MKVNNPLKTQVDIYVDDNDGELKIIGLTLDNNEFWGHEPYLNQPGVINLEFLFEQEDEPDQEIEKAQFELLKSLLEKHNTPYTIVDVDKDGKVIYVQINKDELDITWDEE